jgi:glucosamine-6-phosphate deaminase
MSTYRALAKRFAQQPVNGARLHLVMMDEYIAQEGDTWRACPPDAHYSCTRFGEVEIRTPLNTGLAVPIPRDHLHVPDAAEPARYEALLESLGGVDVFILASGASDGHVAFNPPGTLLETGTRRVALAETTRRDNMHTFPDFRSLDEVPRYGVSVGPATIARHSRSALMILIGADKGEALRRILATPAYEPMWPSTVVHACRNAEILADRTAFAAMEDSDKKTN